MCNIRYRNKLKIILVPYPGQGHVTPMLKLASTFACRGFEPIIITPEFIHHRIIRTMNPQTEISCMSIPDGLKEDEPRYYFSIENVMEKMLPIHLERIISSVNEDGRVVCVVVDLLTSSSVEVTRRCGVTAAGFWQAMLATYSLIDAIPEMMKTVCVSDTGKLVYTHI